MKVWKRVVTDFKETSEFIWDPEFLKLLLKSLKHMTSLKTVHRVIIVEQINLETSNKQGIN